MPTRTVPLASYPVSTLADLIAAAQGLVADARIHGGHAPQDVRLAKAVTLAMTERTHRDGGITRRLEIEIR